MNSWARAGGVALTTALAILGAAAGLGVLTTSAAALAVCGGVAAGAATWSWARLPSRAWDELEAVARTGLGAVPGEDEAGRVRSAIADRERAHTATLDAARLERDAGWQALDASPFGIVLLDRDGRILWVNVVFGQMVRLRGPPIGKTPLEATSLLELHEVVEATLADGVAERPAVTHDRDLIVRGARLPSGALAVRIEDVTVAREAERARTDFVANVSHELRTPVASILGYLDLVLAEPDRLPDDVVPLLQTAERNGRRLRDLFEDLLKLHRIEARRRELPRTRQRLAPLLEEAVGAARDKAAMRRQELVLTCPPDLEVRVNAEALGQIVSNLASNASSYSGEGARIEVVAARVDGGVRVDVVDQGIGIAERHHERIFERFYRVDEARSRSAGGTGLGLAIVKHYALATGCRVTLSSREGAGSTFSVHLP